MKSGYIPEIIPLRLGNCDLVYLSSYFYLKRIIELTYIRKLIIDGKVGHRDSISEYPLISVIIKLEGIIALCISLWGYLYEIRLQNIGFCFSLHYILSIYY
jgi:hypothetical protein